MPFFRLTKFRAIALGIVLFAHDGATVRGIDRQGPVPASTAEMLNWMWSRGKAEGAGPVKLKTFPLRVSDIDYIIPMGNMQSGHVTPSDHLYLVPKLSNDK